MNKATVRWEVVRTYEAEIDLDEYDIDPDELTEGETFGTDLDDHLAELEIEDHSAEIDNRTITDVDLDDLLDPDE
jgi:hypothetical protein